MKERPIIMTADSVRAILDGRKTMTRRVIKPQPDNVARDDVPFIYTPKQVVTENGLETIDHIPGDPNKKFIKTIKCPYGIPGDRLWVREKWQAISLDGQWWHEVKEHRELYNWAWTNPVEPAYKETPPRWLPSIHMPRAASRIALEVVNVRVEQVQDASYHDLEAEGMRGSIHDAMINYISLWDTLNAKRGYPWTDNPWVWVIELKVLP